METQTGLTAAITNTSEAQTLSSIFCHCEIFSVISALHRLRKDIFILLLNSRTHFCSSYKTQKQFIFDKTFQFLSCALVYSCCLCEVWWKPQTVELIQLSSNIFTSCLARFSFPPTLIQVSDIWVLSLRSLFLIVCL